MNSKRTAPPPYALLYNVVVLIIDEVMFLICFLVKIQGSFADPPPSPLLS